MGSEAMVAWTELFHCVPPLLENFTRSACDLCQRVETLPSESQRFHPSKCRCLARSYSVLLRCVLFLTSLQICSSSSSSSFLQRKVAELLKVLLHTLQEGERFIQDCTYPQGSWIPGSWIDNWWIVGSLRRSLRRKQEGLIINKALAIALSTEIFDVHLHDFLWCISTLIWVLAEYCDGALGGLRIEIERVENLLKEIWASADEEGDVKSMQALFNNFKAKEHEEICKLICSRLSENTSKAQPNLINAVVPTYLLMDPPGFQFRRHPSTTLGNDNFVDVFETSRLIGGKFACKHFHGTCLEEEFVNEAAIQASLQHANVVHLVWCMRRAASEDRALVMELMDKDLGELIKTRRSAGMDPPFSLLAAVDLMLQIAKGMEYLHGLGIMHRDLKSYNILVRHWLRASYLDKRDHLSVKVADFGTSKVKHNTSLFTTKRVGTSIWRAPEVVDDEDETKYTKKADVYSFAIVCSEILTGLPPDQLLPCQRISELSRVLKEGTRPKLPSSCPPAIASYIEKCWHQNASERPTFKQICRVFRYFKACCILGETEMLASPLPDDMLNSEELQRIAAERQSQGMFYHPVLDIPSETLPILTVLERIREQNARDIKQLEDMGFKQLLQLGKGVPMEIMMSKVMKLKLTMDVILGRGSLGFAYKCKVEDGSFVALRWFGHLISDKRDIEEKLANMVKLKHENLVPLLGQCYGNVLVSEYMTSGSCLSNLLHGGDTTLDWDTRVRVALDAASGMDYLHDHGYTHGHIKSSNILLIDNYTRCILSDYGIARLMRATAANEGYKAPESVISEKADVYSYGMLLLELLTSRDPAEGFVWVQPLPRKEQFKIFDSRVNRDLDTQQQMIKMLLIAFDCLVLNPSQRPTMKRVVKMINDINK